MVISTMPPPAVTVWLAASISSCFAFMSSCNFCACCISWFTFCFP